MKTTLAAVAFAAAFTSSLALAQTVVVPAGYDVLEGNSNNSFPWGYATTSYTGMRHQQLYDTSHFTSQAINFPVIIQGMRLRANGGVVHAGGVTHSNVVVQLASSPIDYTAAAVATAWAGHLGPDLTTVFSGSVTTLPSAGASPNDWILDIPFATPFLYDPAAGNDLVVDVDRPLVAGSSIAFDNVSSSGTPAPMGTRVYGYTAYPNPSGMTANYALVCEFTYVPASGLYAGFSSDVQIGPSPLTVNFTDSSFSSDPGGVQGWAWDFENDGTIDSTAQNPQHIYTNCGTYDVSLTAFDAAHAPSTIVQTAFITTDATTADFSEALIAPLILQFTDTSTGTPTVWDWDLDGDGTTDSTVQNPAWVYANANPVNVTLTVGRLCGPTSTITKSVVPLQQISTGFARNNGNGNFGSVLFDLDVLNPTGVAIESLDVYASTVVQACNLDMYVKPGTYNGFYTNADDWVLVGTATGTSSGATNTPFSMVFNTPVYLPQGLSGVKFHYRDFYCSYTTGTGVLPFGNADLTMTLGTSQYTTTTNAFTGSTITPRWFAGTIYYSTHNLSGNADYGMFAPGCPSSMGQSTLTASATPALGTSMTVDINNLPTNAALMMTGFSNTTSVLGALPFDLTSFGAPGCDLRVSPDANSLLLGAGNVATWAFTIPNTAALASTKLFQQAVVLDPAANGAGASGSASAAMIIGN